MQVKLDNIELVVSKKIFGSTINIEFYGQIISVQNYTKSRIVDIIKSNYELIKDHYISNTSKNGLVDIDKQELNLICVKILFYYIDQYNRWKEQYEKSNYELKFNQKDFDHPTTKDIIVFYLKEKHPDNWITTSAKYLDMSLTEFDEYWKRRQEYFNK